MPYLESDFDVASKLSNLLGSFWAQTYGGAEQVESLLYAYGRLALQSHADLLELVGAMSRLKLPVLHTSRWFPLTIKLSELNQGRANLPKWNGEHTWGDGIQYDIPTSSAYYVWELPADFVDCACVADRITGATVLWTKGADFFLRDNGIWFRENPFAGFPGIPFTSQTLFDAVGEMSDAECTVWCYRAQFDWEAVHKQFGYVLDLKLPSSEGYKAFVNAVFDALVEGTHIRSIEQMFSAISDVPVIESTEIVESVLTDNAYRWVVTDKTAHRLHIDSDVTVAVADVLEPGSTVSDTLKFFEFNRGQVPDVADMRALALSRNFLASGYFQDLVFENKTVPLVVETDVDGYTKISFEVGGTPADIEKFWDDVHASGIAAGKTLAMLLDTRPVSAQITQPTAAALPATINPLRFLIENNLRNNYYAVRLRPATYGPKALGLYNARMLRRVIPPHTACLIFVELEFPGDDIIMDGDGNETTPGYAEELNVFLGESLADDIDPNDYIDEAVRCYQINGQCV